MIKPRQALSVGTTLKLYGNEYKITDILGDGSNAICYRATYDDSSISGKRHNCIIKELFPLHERGLIYRGDEGNIHVEAQAQPVFELHKQSFLRGCKIGIDLNDERPDKSMPMLNTYEANGTMYAVIGISGGETLQGKDVRTLQGAAETAIAILHALRPFHSARLWHLDISPDNILLMPRDKGEKSVRALLIDYNSVFSSNEIVHDRGVYLSIKPPFSAPEVRLSDVINIGAATDLYSVVAVFARLLTDDFDGDIASIRPGLPIFENVPQTAAHKAVSIVRKGLRFSSLNRYKGIDELLLEFEELLNRIERAGVTLPALWEASSVLYKQTIASCPQYSYVTGNGIPSQLRAGDMDARTLITGDGGMGKTTALLRIWHSGIRRYNPNAPVPLYIKLNDYSREKSIRMRCLDRLRFNAQASTVADALKSLDAIFSQPNSVLLLLDGFNEVADAHRQDLLSEIDELCKSGVRIAVSSRSDVSEISRFTRVELSPLTSGFVRDYLNARHLLYPDRQALAQLLTNPMMLVMYTAVVGNSKTHADTFDESALIKAYLDYAITKAHSLKAAELATSIILPCAALAMYRQGAHTISSAELFSCVERIYSNVKSKHFYKEFPEYIGESLTLLEGSENADAWFGAMVNRLIGRELSLLVKNESGDFSFSHQVFRDYFINMGSAIGRKLKRIRFRTGLPKVLVPAFGVLALAFCIWGAAQLGGPRGGNVFPHTEEEVKLAEEALTIMQIATGNFCASLYDGNAMVANLKEPIPAYYGESDIERWHSDMESSLENIKKKAAQFYVLDTSRIDKTSAKLKEGTIPADVFSKMCSFSEEFTNTRDMLLDGLFNKRWLLEEGSPRFEEMLAKYGEWADNKVYEYILMMRYAVYDLPEEYSNELLDIKGLLEPFPQLLRDTSFEKSEYDSMLNRTREVEQDLILYFKTKGVLE